MRETPSKAGRGRPRLAATDHAIQTAALELLRAEGPQAVTIDAVAARAGVARTTIYRRYRRREELIQGVLSRLFEADLPPPTLPTADKLRWLLARVESVLGDGLGPGGIAAVLTESDPSFSSALRDQLAGRLAVLHRTLAEDTEAGRLRPHVDPDTLVGLLLGAYLAEMLRHGVPRSGWMERLVELLGPGVLAAP